MQRLRRRRRGGDGGDEAPTVAAVDQVGEEGSGPDSLVEVEVVDEDSRVALDGPLGRESGEGVRGIVVVAERLYRAAQDGSNVGRER